MFKLNWRAEYHGPNPYCDTAAVVADIAIGTAVIDLQTADALLTEAFPEWKTGLAHALQAASINPLQALGSMLAHWALAALNEVRGFLSEAGAVETESGIRIWLSFHDPRLSRAMLAQALRVAFRRSPAPMEDFWQACRQQHPDFQARILMTAASSDDIPVLPFQAVPRCWQFGWGSRSRVFLETASNADGFLGASWQHNKQTTKAILRSLGLPAPEHRLIREIEELDEAVGQVGFPCVLKPLDGGGGRGVTANIATLQALRQAFDFARSQSRGALMLEHHVPGNDYRLMVINGQFVAAIHRQASFVTGDGESSIAKLIEACNRQRSRNLPRSRYLYPIAIDDTLHQHLATQGWRYEDIPPVATRITLRSNANRSTGGICTDVTLDIHPEVRTMAEQIAAVSGLAMLGLDYLSTDISKSPWEVGGAFIEINATPGLSACVAAGFDEKTMARLTLGPGLGRIPVDLRLLTPEQLTDQLCSLDNATQPAGHGWASGTQLQIGNTRLKPETSVPWAGVRAALQNPQLESLEILATPDELFRYGLPVDRVRQCSLGEIRLPGPWREVIERCSDRIV